MAAVNNTASGRHDATDIVSGIRTGRLTAREALEQCLSVFEAVNGHITAVISTGLEEARRRADQTDANIARGDPLRTLEGLPVTIKETFALRDFPFTWGNPARVERLSAIDSDVARLLKANGAIIWGKTNIPELMQDWETDNRLHGPTRNPFDSKRSAGGSSGGSAAAVASGMTPVDIGSDMGGSIRIPAHYCGVYALKPSWNLIPMGGHALDLMFRVADMNVAGPLARSARDLALMLDAFTARRPVPEQPAPRRRDGRIRVAALFDHPDCPIDGPYRDGLDRFLVTLRRSGVQVDESLGAPVDLSRATELMNLMARAETATRLSPQAYEEALRLAQTARDKPQRSFEELNAIGATLSHRDWLLLHEERLRIKRAWAGLFETYDAFLCPSAATTAPLLQRGIPAPERSVCVNGKPLPILAQHLWSGIASLSHLPAIVMPVGALGSGLPFGIQMVGPEFADFDLIDLAVRFEHLRAS